MDGYHALTDDGKKRLCRSLPCDPFMAMVLVSTCFLTLGSYWVFDTPGAIFTQLQDWFGKDDYTRSMNLNLYSIYSWPNTILAFFGGYILDRLTGVRMGALLFCGFILVGQTLFSLGVQYKSYWVCFFGRFVFGLGGESLTVAQNTYTIRWFEGPRLALVFGLVVAFARIGSSINFVVTPKLANMSSGVPLSVWVGTAICGVSLLFCITLALLDKWGESRLPAKSQRKSDDAAAEAPVSIMQVREFPASAWLLYAITAFFYICVLTFYTVASDIMQNTGRHYDEETATLFLSIPNFVSVVGSPLFGRVVDRQGRALMIVLSASGMMVVAHLAFLALAQEWVDMWPGWIMLWLGVAYSLGAAALWPTLSCIIGDRLLGTAYGCMTATQNLALAIFPLAIGLLQDAPGIKDTRLQYTLPIIIFIACAGVAIALTLVLIGVDRRVNGGIMNASAEGKKRIRLEREEVEPEAEDVRSTSSSVVSVGSINQSLINAQHADSEHFV